MAAALLAALCGLWESRLAKLSETGKQTEAGKKEETPSCCPKA